MLLRRNRGGGGDGDLERTDRGEEECDVDGSERSDRGDDGVDDVCDGSRIVPSMMSR